MDDKIVGDKPVVLVTIGDVIKAVAKCVESDVDLDSQLADILEKVLGHRVVSAQEAKGFLDAEVLERDDSWPETKISELATETEFEAKALNAADLEKLLREHKKALAAGEKESAIAMRLAEQYGVEESQVKGWLDRVKLLTKEAEAQGFALEVAKDVAEEGVIRAKRMADELVATGLSRKKSIKVAEQVVVTTLKTREVIAGEKLKQVAILVKKDETIAVVLKHSRRSADKVEVAKKVEEQVATFVDELKQGMEASQPRLGFEGHKAEIDRITRQAIESVWAGKSDSLIIAEVVTETDGGVTRSGFVETIKAIVGVEDDGAIDIAVRKASESVTVDIRKDVKLATRYEFVKRSEEIADKIFGLNPEIDPKAVTKYAEVVVEASMPTVSPGQRISREISGRYGLKEDVCVRTNVFYRAICGLTDHEELSKKIEECERAGIGTELQVLSAEGRGVSSFLSQLRSNPLLAKGVDAIRQQVIRRLLTNRMVVDGATSFLSQAGFNSVFGVKVATAVPTVMGYFAGGGTFSGAISGIVQAKSVSGWIGGLLSAGGAGAGATGTVAATAGAAAGATVVTTTVATGATAAVGLTAAQVIPVVGQVLAAVAAVVTVVKPIIKKVNGFLKSTLGIDLKKWNLGLKIKKFVSDDLNLGGLAGSVAGFAFNLAGMLVALPSLIMAMAFGRLLVMIGWLVPAVIGGIMLYMLIVVNPQASTLAPTAEMIAGDIGDGQYTDVDPVFGDDCESTLACVAFEALTQNGFVRVVKSNVLKAALVLRAIIGRFPLFDVVRFVAIMTYNTNRFDSFQCIGYSIAADAGLTTSPTWQSLYAGTQSGCVKVAPENAGLGDHVVFPRKNGHYHIGVLVKVRKDGSGEMYDVNNDGNGSLHRWPITSIVNFVSGQNSRNRGKKLTILRCGI